LPTERYKVVEVVCLQVVVIFGWDVAESFEGDNVMNIKIHILLADAARLAAMPIAFTYRPLLAFPVRAIVSDRTAFPVRITATGCVSRQPFAFALHVAEVVLAQTELFLLTGKRLAASVTGYCDRRGRLVRKVALQTTEGLATVANLVRYAYEVFPAHGTRQSHALVTRGIRTYQGLEVGRDASYVAKVMVACFELVGVAFKLLTAVSARYGEFAGLGGHEKPPVGVTDALAEGAPVANRRLGKHIELPAIRQQQVHPQHMKVYHGLPFRARKEGS